MIYFISDTHFGHNKIIGYCKRPFDDIETMDSTILGNINLVVKPKDTLYILGDFCHKGGDTKEYRERILCNNVHIILGNHDNPNKFNEGFSSVAVAKEIIHCNQKIYLCHYPMRSWPSSHRKSWSLYGHVHGRLHSEDCVSGRLTLDVGVDNKRQGVGFGTPWSFKEVQKFFSDRTKNFQG